MAHLSWQIVSSKHLRSTPMTISQHSSITHFTSSNTFTISQSGFRKKSSTDKAAYTLINDILLALNNKRIVGGLFF
jgi:hypothetical protein